MEDLKRLVASKKNAQKRTWRQASATDRAERTSTESAPFDVPRPKRRETGGASSRRDLSSASSSRSAQSSRSARRAAASESESEQNKEHQENETTSMQGSEDTAVGMTPEEVTSKLRELSQPVRLFAETERGRWYRLHRVLRGDFSAAAAQQSDAEYLRATRDSAAKKEAAAREKKRRSVKRMRKYVAWRSRDAVRTTADYVHFFIKRVLLFWQLELAHEAQKHVVAAAGDIESVVLPEELRQSHAMWSETRRDLRPFVRDLMDRTMDDTIVKKAAVVIDHCIKQDYVAAEQAYFDLSIGRSNWAQGVTQVGIHIRASRNRVMESNLKNPMDDPVMRRATQAIKTLVSTCQRMWPKGCHDVSEN
ncbi:MAG: hypothetical protein MHM6MM_002048 [Cercozoa sp. M6MM]